MELNEKLLNRLGIADAMAHRAKATAERLQQAAAKHHDSANGDIDALGKQIEAAGVGADEDAENRYCRALVARGHMAQAHHLAGLDAARMPEVGSSLEKGRISQAKAEAAGQGAMDFEENQHPRAAEGTAGQYKPGEFVPKGEQQGAAEKPDHEKEAWELSRSEMKSSSDYDKSYMSNYVDAAGNKTASSRTTPAQDEETPLGTWRRDDYKGIHGTEVEQLRELDPNDLTASEDTDAPKKADVERYTEWAKEGKKAPPIHVVETDSGKLKISNGHRRWLAAKAAGTKIRAWVSPAVTIPDQVDSAGKPMKTGLTHELAIHHAIEAGHRVPDEVLQDYPELKSKHDQKRKEALRDAAQSAQEDGHPGLAEAHQDIDPKEDWKKNGVRSQSFKSWFGDWENDPKNASQVVDTENGEPQDTEPVPVYHGTWSPDKFSAFDPDKLGANISHPTCALGFFFADTEAVAKDYAGFYTRTFKPKNLNDIAREMYGKDYRYVLDEADRKKVAAVHQAQEEVKEQTSQPDSRVLTCYLNIRNPKVMSHAEYHDLFHAHQGPEWGTMQPHQREQATRRAVDKMKTLRHQLAFKGHDGIIIDDWDGNGALRETKGQRTYVAFGPTQIKSVDNEGTFDPSNPNMNKAVRSACEANELCRPFVPPDMPRWRGPRPSPNSYLPLNGVEDREKFLAMAKEMAAGTWTWDKPLIRCGDQLLTGSHRYAAAQTAGVPLETLDVDDLFKRCGRDFQETWERLAQPYTSWINNLDAALKTLPPEILALFGIDLG